MANAPKKFQAPKSKYKYKRTDRREHAARRGYDWRWTQLRQQYAESHPICEECERRGLIVPMDDVDHIIPFVSLSDPLRLCWDNLQSLCRKCHNRKTASGNVECLPVAAGRKRGSFSTG